MNQNEVKVIQRDDLTTLLYSHDTGFTRYAVDLFADAYRCRLNEVPCFRRGTHDRMVKLYGDSLNDRRCQTFGDEG